ncbi:glyoxylate reductase 1 homolog (Arabidopsis) [Nesidiocoris tenuis]|uniref:Glyoxylate reductase 1 homolog (Arabidopsis) n=1 Tax=Nesidiocoris tenuis TaxID=355587 RepID=A0ABN7ADE1_9HEMI|nr:glyoxylate reductase 1 homolog (Arabidopsis) [Nesidiocoris tenuis]
MRTSRKSTVPASGAKGAEDSSSSMALTRRVIATRFVQDTSAGINDCRITSLPARSPNFVGSRIFPVDNHTIAEAIQRDSRRTPRSQALQDASALITWGVSSSTQAFGFLGLGLLAQHLVKNLLKSYQTIHLWDKNLDTMLEFRQMGAHCHASAISVVEACDIVFCCLENDASVQDIFFGVRGILKAFNSTRAYVEMTPLDPGLMKRISTAVVRKRARFLNLQLIGTTNEAENGGMVAVTSGNESLYDDISSCLAAMCYVSYYIGDNNRATAMAIILRMSMSSQLVALTEMMSVADRLGFELPTMHHVLEHTNIFNEFTDLNTKNIININFNSPSTQLLTMTRHAQQAVRLAEIIGHQLPGGSAVAETLKFAVSRGFGRDDATAAFLPARFGY